MLGQEAAVGGEAAAEGESAPTHPGEASPDWQTVDRLEELVADYRPGDRPDDPPDPEARTHVVRFELSAETFALLRQARSVLDDDHGHNLPDDPFVAALCSAVLDGAPTTETTGRAKFQIAVTVCERCQKGWQEGAGAQLAISPAAVERARCDAQHLGSLDGDAPERAHQDIPPSVARFVWRRDGGRCRVPGCRSARGLELHHLVHRADGGSHDASNIALVCSACHQSHHAGTLTITGTADHLEVRRPADFAVRSPAEPRAVAPTGARVGAQHEPGTNSSAEKTTTLAHREPRPAAPTAHVGAPSKLDTAVLQTQTRDALVGLGWKPAIAVPPSLLPRRWWDQTRIERLIFEALRQCSGGDRSGRARSLAP